MKKLALICVFTLAMNVGVASARCIGPVVNGKCLGTEVPGLDEREDTQREDTYRGSSGASYQYDLNKPQDQNKYLYDRDAQRRDQMNTDPRKDTDERQGQKGGGIYKNPWLD